jgi:uncharacterized membrane protein
MQYSRDASEFDRAIAFIDATFAVALTLLITSLDIGDKSSSFTSLSALADAVGSQFVAFVIAFVVIAGYWLMNHRMVATFVALDTRTIVASLCLVAAVVVLPFSTTAVGDPEVADLPLPTALMAVNIAAMSALHTLIWVLAVRGGLLDHTSTAGEWRERVIDGLAPAAVFLISVPVAFVASPGIARLLWLSLLAVNPAVGALMARARRLRDER